MVASDERGRPLLRRRESEGGTLVARARAGDASAFRALFEREAPPVRRFLRDLLRDAEAADEATQETFVRAHRSLSVLRDEEKVLPWLLGIARNVFHEELRRRRHRVLPAASELARGDDDQPSRGGAGDAGVALVDDAPSPEALLIGREADAQLDRALASLGEERRAALLLRIDHHLDYDEIREVMGWTLAKVKNEIHRARLELRVRLLPYLGGK